MKVLSGKDISAKIEILLKEEVDRLAEQKIQPCLAVILVGNDPASAVYVNSKKKACERLGIRSVEHRLSEDSKPEELYKIIEDLNADSSVNGILCQVPLPPQHDENSVIQSIDPAKDVDCFHPYNFGLLAAGMPRFMPCTPFGVLQILKHSGYSTSGKKVAVVGRSNIVGRPLSILMSLKGWDATVTVCHSRTENMAEVCREADIVVAAIGKPEFITADFVKSGAVVIDVGINRVDDASKKKGYRLAGDVDYEGISGVAEAATPVPGGVGPMTIGMLMYNTINAARYQANLDKFEL